jgi:very-short-patch-repair endonuclease
MWSWRILWIRRRANPSPRNAGEGVAKRREGDSEHPPEVDRARRLRQTQSVAETILWERSRRNQLNGWGFRRQAPVGGFVVDFLCHKPALIVEVDGPTHDDEEQKAFDATRTEKLEALGYLVIRVREHVVRDGEDPVLTWIAEVGGLVLEPKFVPARLRRMDIVPLP